MTACLGIFTALSLLTLALLPLTLLTLALLASLARLPLALRALLKDPEALHLALATLPLLAQHLAELLELLFEPEQVLDPLGGRHASPPRPRRRRGAHRAVHFLRL